MSTCREGKLGGFSFFGHPSHLGLVQDLGCAPFWALTFSYFPFVMVVPRVLTHSIDVKLGVFPEGTSIIDTAKALRDYFAEEAQFKVVAIQQCPNRLARVTFVEGGEAAKADFQDQRFIRICGVECEVISPAPPVEKVLVYNSPMRTMTAQCIGSCLTMARSRVSLTRRELASWVFTQVPGW